MRHASIDRPTPAASGYFAALLVVALATLAAWFLLGRENLADVVMLYLLGVVLVSLRFGFRVSVAAALLSVLAFDVMFIPPYLTFTVHDLRHVVTFGVMLLVAVVIAGLTQRVRNEAESARRSEQRTALLYALSRELARTQDRTEILRAAVRHLERAFDARVVEEATAGGFSLNLALTTLHIVPKNPERFSDPEQRALADACATQIALALERASLAEEAAATRVEVERERLRSTLLSSVSHDLRTPIAVLKGAASTLLDDHQTLSDAARIDLTETLLEESEHLEQVVSNVLTMTRVESGGLTLRKELQSVEELVGSALDRLERVLGSRSIDVAVPGDVFVSCDAALVVQVLVNLLENAVRHTPPETPIAIVAKAAAPELVLEVSDRGPGVPPEEAQRVFEKFHHGSGGGVGLGLAICRAIVEAHGGRIWAEAREGGGATFGLALPWQDLAPLPEPREAEGAG